MRRMDRRTTQSPAMTFLLPSSQHDTLEIVALNTALHSDDRRAPGPLPSRIVDTASREISTPEPKQNLISKTSNEGSSGLRTFHHVLHVVVVTLSMLQRVIDQVSKSEEERLRWTSKRVVEAIDLEGKEKKEKERKERKEEKQEGKGHATVSHQSKETIRHTREAPLPEGFHYHRPGS